MLISELEKDDKIVVYKDEYSTEIEFIGYVDFIDVSWQNEYNEAILKNFEDKKMFINDTMFFTHWQDHIESITESMSEVEEIPKAGDTLCFKNGKVFKKSAGAKEWVESRFKPNDTVNHPAHYTQGKVEVIEFIEQVTKDYNANVAYHIGNAIKYIARSPHKNGKEDIAKAKWYLERAFERWEG